MHRHSDDPILLLKKSAETNAIPGGFEFAGTALHYAGLNGCRGWPNFSSSTEQTRIWKGLSGTTVMRSIINVEDLRRAARRRLPRVVYDYLDGGAEAEVTLRED